MRQTIKLTESELKHIIEESVKKEIYENNSYTTPTPSTTRNMYQKGKYPRIPGTNALNKSLNSPPPNFGLKKANMFDIINKIYNSVKDKITRKSNIRKYPTQFDHENNMWTDTKGRKRSNFWGPKPWINPDDTYKDVVSYHNQVKGGEKSRNPNGFTVFDRPWDFINELKK